MLFINDCRNEEQQPTTVLLKPLLYTAQLNRLEQERVFEASPVMFWWKFWSPHETIVLVFSDVDTLYGEVSDYRHAHKNMNACLDWWLCCTPEDRTNPVVTWRIS